MLFIREAKPAVPQRIVQKLLADLRARGIESVARVRALAAGAPLWTTFARCAAREQVGDRQDAVGAP